MPYNTRRKSLSLPALGIQLPQASRAHRASISKPAPSGSPTAAAAAPSDAPPAKRVKRAHSSSSQQPLSPPATGTPVSAAPAKSVTFADRPRSSGRDAIYEHTPPPSPGRAEATRIDVEGIKDDIVVGVIEQLEQTGNRPHLIKELATVLSTTNTSVSNSANPAALLSSRLASYMRRPWTALAPCPIAKELIPVHPRKVFYYLTTTPRQPMPTTPSDILIGGGKGHPNGKRIISPSLSNASQDDDDDMLMAEDRKRAALSPSPEVDLSFDLDEAPAPTSEDALPDFPTPGSTLSSQRASMARDGHEPERDLGLNHRAESPPLEGDEREFTDTARGMRLRGLSGGADDLPAAAKPDEERAQTNSEAVRALFGPAHAHGHANGHLTAAAPGEGSIMSSPMIKPATHSEMLVKTEPHPAAAVHDVAMVGASIDVDVDEMVLGLDCEIGRPENMDLDELDDFFQGY